MKNLNFFIISVLVFVSCAVNPFLPDDIPPKLSVEIENRSGDLSFLFGKKEEIKDLYSIHIEYSLYDDKRTKPLFLNYYKMGNNFTCVAANYWNSWDLEEEFATDQKGELVFHLYESYLGYIENTVWTDYITPHILDVRVIGEPKKDELRIAIFAEDTGGSGLTVSHWFYIWAFDNWGNMSDVLTKEVELANISFTLVPELNPALSMWYGDFIKKENNKYELVANLTYSQDATPYFGTMWKISQINISDRNGNNDLLTENGPYYYSYYYGPTTIPVVRMIIR